MKNPINPINLEKFRRIERQSKEARAAARRLYEEWLLHQTDLHREIYSKLRFTRYGATTPGIISSKKRRADEQRDFVKKIETEFPEDFYKMPDAEGRIRQWVIDLEREKIEVLEKFERYEAAQTKADQVSSCLEAITDFVKANESKVPV